MMTRSTHAQGLTLIELLVVLAIGTMLTVGVLDTIRTMFIFTAQQPQALQAVDLARSAGNTITNELRNATLGVDGSYPLQEASSTEIVFYSPYRSGSGSVVRRIRYFVASSTLYKGVVVPSGTPASYVLSQEQVSRVLALASTSPLFQYFDSTYTGSSTPLVQPVKATDVTFVQVSLTVLRGDRRNATTTFTLTTGSTIRNLKTNLDN